MRSTLQSVLILCALQVAPALAGENFPPMVVGHLNRQGPIVSSKFFRSWYPTTQMTVHYCIDENLKGGKNEGANSAANTHCVIALFNEKGRSRWIFGDEVDVGQGDVKDFSNGIVSGESVTYADGDPLSTPSRRSKFRFNTAGGKLVLISD